jgi:hypothetical protein
VGGLIAGLLGGGLVGAVPAIFAVAALIDCARVGASWYWYWIIFSFPIVGPLAYFVVVRSPLLTGSSSALVPPHVARRQQARRRLKQLQVQLAHWRGPGVLSEAGDELLVLGKLREAEAHFREARQNGAGVEDVNFGLAQTLEMQGRWSEAAPLFAELVAVEPDSHLGEGPLHLARCLDESGQRDEAEAALCKVLERRTVIEAQIRLARLLYAKGEKDEADRIVAEVRNDAKLLPRYLKRLHRRWLWSVRKLTATTRLPKPRVEGALSPAGNRILIVVAALALAALVAGTVFWVRVLAGAPGVEAEHAEAQKLRGSLASLDRQNPWTRGDLAKAELSVADVDRYLRLRQALSPNLQALKTRQSEMRGKMGTMSGMLLHGGTVPGEWMRSENGFTRGLLQALQREAMGPRTFASLIDLADWRFLRRHEALAFGLPEYAREDWRLVEGTLAGHPEALGGDPRRIEQMRAKAAALEKQAGEAVELTPAARSALESRRPALEALHPAELGGLLEILQRQGAVWGD